MGKFDPTTGAPISKAESEKKAKKWKDGKKSDTVSNFIGRDWIEKLLKKKGCTGIWICYGESDDGKEMEPFLIAGDINGKYIMSEETKREATTATDDIINQSTKCPPDCP